VSKILTVGVDAWLSWCYLINTLFLLIISYFFYDCSVTNVYNIDVFKAFASC